MKFLAKTSDHYAYGASETEAMRNLRSAGGDANAATVYSVPDDHQLVKPNPIGNTKTSLIGSGASRALTAVRSPRR